VLAELAVTPEEKRMAKSTEATYFELMERGVDVLDFTNYSLICLNVI
jgi:hypothetical protein